MSVVQFFWGFYIHLHHAADAFSHLRALGNKGKAIGFESERLTLKVLWFVKHSAQFSGTTPVLVSRKYSWISVQGLLLGQCSGINPGSAEGTTLGLLLFRDYSWFCAQGLLWGHYSGLLLAQCSVTTLVLGLLLAQWLGTTLDSMFKVYSWISAHGPLLAPCSIQWLFLIQCSGPTTGSVFSNQLVPL